MIKYKLTDKPVVPHALSTCSLPTIVHTSHVHCHHVNMKSYICHSGVYLLQQGPDMSESHIIRPRDMHLIQSMVA